MSTPGGLPRLPAVDQRVSMAVLGGVLGIVLVALIAVAPPGRNPIVTPGSQPTTGASSALPFGACELGLWFRRTRLRAETRPLLEQLSAMQAALEEHGE